MNKKTLLEKAKSISKVSRMNVNLTDEHIELAIAFVKGEISYSAARLAIGATQGNGAYVVMLRALSYGYKTGKIKLP